MEKLINKTFIGVFGTLGTAALFSALFLGAPHQFCTAALCGIACLGLYLEIKSENKSKTL